MTNISDLLVGNGLMIAVFCMILGLFIKGSTKIPNKFIPCINMVVSVILVFVIPNTYTDKDMVSKIIILMFIGLSSVGLYETLCIIVKDRFSIDLKSILSKVFGVEDGENKPIEEIQTDETDSQKDDTNE